VTAAILLGCLAGCSGPSEGGSGLAWGTLAAGQPDETSAAAAAQQEQEEDTPSMVKVHVFNSEGTLVGPVDSPRVTKTDAEWRKLLTPEQYVIARNKGTERPFCGTLLDNKQEGIYSCVCCGLPLFSSNAKFHSGTGWPSFFQPVAATNVVESRDLSHGMVRVEITCARCDCHLGHVFDDGPRPTGLRYCLNSESLTFTKKEHLKSLADPAAAQHSSQ
jgi:methionine-R-sulfoxide reductase